SWSSASSAIRRRRRSSRTPPTATSSSTRWRGRWGATRRWSRTGRSRRSSPPRVNRPRRLLQVSRPRRAPRPLPPSLPRKWARVDADEPPRGELRPGLCAGASRGRRAVVVALRPRAPAVRRRRTGSGRPGRRARRLQPLLPRRRRRPARRAARAAGHRGAEGPHPQGGGGPAGRPADRGSRPAVSGRRDARQRAARRRWRGLRRPAFGGPPGSAGGRLDGGDPAGVQHRGFGRPQRAPGLARRAALERRPAGDVLGPSRPFASPRPGPLAGRGRRAMIDAIGVFDSGVGGLTVVSALRRRLPGESILYLGDTARLPYGSKSRDTVTRYTRRNIEFLTERGVKAVVVACNTASALALPDLDMHELPTWGVIEPGARKAAAVSRGKVGVIATEATVRSDAYP